uniref:CCHC-type domain-containing protein n=1 Tax=Tanacetum cinerariifolium TaxID=118510 RepID=A0A6L2MU80_TANCI|nr:hypothetical protein [Tanacetum cinerariifolium]
MQTQTSNALHNAIMEAGGKDRPPMLAPGKDNDIYFTVDACPNAYEIWKAIERSKQGESINVQDLETNLYWEFRKFTSRDEWQRSQLDATRNRGKAIVNSPPTIYDQEPTMVAEDDEMSRDKEIDKLMALISISFKKIYKPTNNNLLTSSNTSRANHDNSLRINRGTGYDNQRIVNVTGARENVGTQVVQQSGIQCYNCKEYGHVARECQNPKQANDAAYHKEKILLCKQEEVGFQLNAKQADWRDDTDDEHDDQELKAHYMYMAKIQEVTPDDADNSGPIFDSEPLQKDDDDDLANERDLLASLIEKLKCEIDDSKTNHQTTISKKETMNCPEQAFVEYTSSCTDEVGDARLPKFKADFKQQHNEMDNKINTVLKAITDRIVGTLPSNMVKNLKPSTSLVLSARSYPTIDPRFSSHPSTSINAIKAHSKELNIRLLKETDHIFGLADGTKSYPVGIVKDVAVHIGKLKLLNDFYVIDMKKDPETPFLVGRGFLATTNVVIDYRKAKITVGEGITRRTNPLLCQDELLRLLFAREWEIARDVELNPFKDVLVFRRKDKPPKNKDGAWHAKIRLIDPDEEEFTKTLQSIPTTRKLSERETLGWHLKDTCDLGSFREETDKITDLHQIHEEVLFTERKDGVPGIKRRRRDLSSDDVRDLATASGCGQLKEDLESST